MKVWLVAYAHQYGIDFTSFEDEAQAQHGAAVLAVREAQRECTAEVALQIQGFFNLGHDAEAVEMYCKHVPGESFEVHTVEVTPGVRFGMIIAEAESEVVHATRSWPRGDVATGEAWCGRSFWWAAQTVPLESSSFRAWIPKEPRHVTCIGCIVAEGVDGRPA